MNKYAIYDKKSGAVKGTFSKYHWSKEEPIPLTEKEILEEFKEEFSAVDIGIVKIPDALIKPAQGTKLLFDLKKKKIITVKREAKQKK
jgi:hypothetical protein